MLFNILTKVSITITSTRTPTTVPNVAPDCKPNNEIETVTTNSKKLLAPIIPAGDAIESDSFQNFKHKYAIAKIINVFIIKGIAINIICNGFSSILPP